MLSAEHKNDLLAIECKAGAKCSKFTTITKVSNGNHNHEHIIKQNNIQRYIKAIIETTGVTTTKPVGSRLVQRLGSAQ